MEGKVAPVAAHLSPVARDYPSRAFNGFFMPSRFDCSIKERVDDVKSRAESHAVHTNNLLTGADGEYLARQK
jgi:hypothetical protein